MDSSEIILSAIQPFCQNSESSNVYLAQTTKQSLSRKIFQKNQT